MKLELTPPDTDDSIDLTPMIDCIFLLVLFFMMSSTFVEDPPDEKIPFSLTIPSQKSSTPEAKGITISVRGTYLIHNSSSEREVVDPETVVKLLNNESAPLDSPLRVRCEAIIKSATPNKTEDLEGFEIRLPTADEPSLVPQGGADIVSVSHEGKYRFEDSKGARDVANLTDLLAQLKKRPAAGNRPVVLRCDRRCTYQQFMQVKNVLRQAKVGTIFEEIEARDGNNP